MRTRVRTLAVVVLFAVAACGGGGDSEEQVAKFCKAFDNMEVPAASGSPNDLDALKARIDAINAELAAVEDAAPPSLRDEFETTRAFRAMGEDEQYLPKNRKANNEANDEIDSYVRDRCELD